MAKVTKKAKLLATKVDRLKVYPFDNANRLDQRMRNSKIQ